MHHQLEPSLIYGPVQLITSGTLDNCPETNSESEWGSVGERAEVNETSVLSLKKYMEIYKRENLY